MPTRILKALFLGLLLLPLLFVSAATAGPQKQLATLITGVSANGIPVETQVFGYYADVEGYGQVFVICDPVTGNETGYAYVPGVKVGDKKGQKITGYKRGLVEDWNVVKQIDPVNLTLIAPNIYVNLGYTDYSWEQYNKTGKLLRTAYGPATWPGPERGYLIPGSDPDYWLIVAEATNPNPWPVKVNISASIEQWRSSWSLGSGGPELTVDKEVILGANQTKYILVNRGKPSGYYLLADDRDWISERSGCEVWTKIDFETRVTENRDPELPDYLKPNKGYIEFLNVWGGPPIPKDLSQGFTVGYYVTCAPDSRYPSWRFSGTVVLTPNEWGAAWVAHPGSNSENPQTAKQKVEEFFNSHWPSQIPWGGGVVDGIKFDKCESYGAKLYSGPRMISLDFRGPALADYTTPDYYDMDLNRSIPNVVSSSGSEIPVLKYRPVFIEFNRFVPGYSADEGWLLKEVVPGYNVRASDIGRPYFSVTDTLRNYTIDYVRYGSGRSRTYYWKVVLNHHVTIRAVNPDSDVSVTFSRAALALPNLYRAVNGIEDYLEDRLDADVDIRQPNYEDDDYDPTFVEFDTVSLAPGETRTVYDADVATEILIRDPAISFDYNPWGDQYLPNYYVYIGKSDVESALNSVLSYFNWNGEAAFVGYSNMVAFTPNPTTVEQVLSLNRAYIRYKQNKEYHYREVGLIGGGWLDPISYFGGEGQSMRPTDNLWSELMAAKRLSAYVEDRNGKNFWSRMTYDWGVDHWTLTRRIGE